MSQSSKFQKSLKEAKANKMEKYLKKKDINFPKIQTDQIPQVENIYRVPKSRVTKKSKHIILNFNVIKHNRIQI